MRFTALLSKTTFLVSLCVSVILLAESAAAVPSDLIGMWDAPATLDKTTLGSDPAPKGGTLHLGSLGNFDNFNPFAPRGICPSFISLTYETLGETERTEEYMVRGLLAQSFDLSPDRLTMVVKLRPEAKFGDGQKVEAEDVVWTFYALIEDASPMYKNAYRDIDKVEALDINTVKFTFKTAANRELPLVAAQLPVLPSHWWKTRNIGEPQNEPMPSSGPFRIESWNMGASLKLARNKDWWAQNLPMNEGRYNFDMIDIDFYRDPTVMREAFFAGNIDFYAEGTIKDWKMGYDIPPVKDGRIVRAEVHIPGVFGIAGIFMNTRRPILSDIRVRKALSMIFNFERVNKTMFFNSFERPTSFWTGSVVLRARDPMTTEERNILEKLPGINAKDYEALPVYPTYTSTSLIRKAMREALKLLEAAGWTLQDGVLKNGIGQPLELNLILSSPTMTRIFSAYAADLARIGIKLNIVPLDQTQYYNRIRHFDYDLAHCFVRQSEKPGSEQRNIWGSKAADQMSSRNFSGIKSEAIDRLIERIATAQNAKDLINSVRVLDRILQKNCYVIPGWYSQTGHIAWWKDRIEPPGGRPPEARRNNIFSWHIANQNLKESH